MRRGARGTRAFVIGLRIAALTAGATVAAQPAAEKPKPPAAPGMTKPAMPSTPT